MIIRIMLVCMLLVTVGCGDYTSGLYDSDYDGNYESREDACYAMCKDHCDSCWMFFTERHRCLEYECQPQCRIMACDSLGYSSRCYEMFREVCSDGG